MQDKEFPKLLDAVHQHIWDDGKGFVHSHKRGEIPHGHHGARYVKQLLRGNDQVKVWQDAGFDTEFLKTSQSSNSLYRRDKMTQVVEQSQAGRVKMCATELSDGRQAYNVILSNSVEIVCASEHDAFLLFTLLDNTAYDVLPPYVRW